jgi:Transcription factor Tfb4
MSFVLVLDLNAEYFMSVTDNLSLSSLAQITASALNGYAIRFASNATPPLAVIGCTASKIQIFYTHKPGNSFNPVLSDRFRELIGDLLTGGGSSRHCLSGETLLGQGLSVAGCFLNKNNSTGNGKVAVLSCGKLGDLAKQSVEIANVSYAMKSLNARCYILGLKNSAIPIPLASLASRTGGASFPIELTSSISGILQCMMFHIFLEEFNDSFKQPKFENDDEINGCFCVCHANRVLVGYVCSVCLSVFCNETAGTCSVCGSRMRREARNEGPISQQSFSALGI